MLYYIRCEPYLLRWCTGCVSKPCDESVHDLRDIGCGKNAAKSNLCGDHGGTSGFVIMIYILPMFCIVIRTIAVTNLSVSVTDSELHTNASGLDDARDRTKLPNRRTVITYWCDVVIASSSSLLARFPSLFVGCSFTYRLSRTLAT